MENLQENKIKNKHKTRMTWQTQSEVEGQRVKQDRGAM